MNWGSDLALLQARLQEEVDRTIGAQTMLARLSTTFAVLAMLPVAIGLYGTISYGAKRRTNEVGIRVALGTERGSVIWMVLRSGVILCILGLAVGIPLALTMSRYMAFLLYGVPPTDFAAIARAALLLLAIGVIASYIPARRAARIDPMEALRYE